MTETVAKTGTFTLNVATTIPTDSTSRTGNFTLNPLPVSSGQVKSVTGTFILNRVGQQSRKTGTFTLNPATSTVVAGPNVTVNAGDRFTLTAQTETPAAGATIASRAWNLNGVTVGTGRSVQLRAPITRAGTTITPSYTVTDSNGIVSAASSLAVTVRPANIRTGGGRPIVRRTGGAFLMPTSEPAGFTRTAGVQFNVDAPLGSFTPGDAGTPTDGRLPVGHPYYSTLNVYPDNNGYDGDLGNGRYYASRTLSVSNGTLNVFHHSETVDGTVRALGAWLRLIVPGESSQKRLYGRWSALMWSDPTPGYGLAKVVIDDATTNGEQDFPEGPFSSPIGGFQHFTNGGQREVTTGLSWAVPHLFVSEWTPGRLRWLVDDVVVLDTTDRVSAVPMKPTLQTGINGTSVPAPNVSGTLRVAYLTEAAYTG